MSSGFWIYPDTQHLLVLILTCEQSKYGATSLEAALGGLQECPHYCGVEGDVLKIARNEALKPCMARPAKPFPYAPDEDARVEAEVPARENVVFSERHLFLALGTYVRPRLQVVAITTGTYSFSRCAAMPAVGPVRALRTGEKPLYDLSPKHRMQKTKGRLVPAIRASAEGKGESRSEALVVAINSL